MFFFLKNLFKVFLSPHREVPFTEFINLSYKIVLHIFSYLSIQDLGRVIQTCKLWQLIANDNTLWEKLVHRRWKLDLREPIINWKKAYQSKSVKI